MTQPRLIDFGGPSGCSLTRHESLPPNNPLQPIAAKTRRRLSGSVSHERTTMSYGIYLYHPSVREEAERGRELDEFVHPSLAEAVITQFLGGLGQYGYELQSQTAECKTFSKPAGDSHVDVSVYDLEIAFTVSGGDADAIFEALQDASELCDSEHMAMFDSQTGEWQDG